MAVFARLLMVFLTLRLLVPQGICLCHFLDAEEVSHAEKETPLPPEESEEHDEHAPGCPASKAAGGVSLCQAAKLPPAQLALWFAPAEGLLQPAQAAQPARAVSFHHSPDQPIYLTVRALLI